MEAAAQVISNRLQEAEAERQRIRRAKRGRVKMSLPVAPNRRRYVLGPGGQALNSILSEYPLVWVTVPPPGDMEAQGISIVGPKDQVSVVAAAISRHLKEVEATIEETKAARKARKKDRTKVTVPVAPNIRRHVVGSGGETLRNLQKEFEGVRITVPPPEDKETRHITLEGPKESVTAAATVIACRVEEEKLRLKEWRANLTRDARDARKGGKTSTPKDKPAARTG